jgi:hypothetical protein
VGGGERWRASAARKRLVAELRNRQHRAVRKPDDSDPADALHTVVLAKGDSIGQLFAGLSGQRQDAPAVVAVADDRGVWVLVVDQLPAAGAVPTGTATAELPLREGSTVDMLIEYLRLQDGAVRALFQRREVTIELLDDDPIQLNDD